MGKTYVVANRKGGCAKTTTTGALASGLARCGYKVLVVDADPQGNISFWSGLTKSGLDEDTLTLFEVMTREDITMKDAIKKAEYYDVVPADDSLSVIEPALAQDPNKNYALADALSEVKEDYDFIIIDTPPSLGLLTIMAFVAADGGVLIVSDASSFATQGMVNLRTTLHSVKKRANTDLKITGILVGRVDLRTLHFREMQEITDQLGSYFNAPVFKTSIRQSTVVMNCQMHGIDIFDAQRINPATQDYATFVGEFLELEGYEKPDIDKVFGKVFGKKAQ